MADLALRILMTAQDGASPIVRSLARSLESLAATSFKGLAHAAGNLAFGFRNLGTSGTVGMDAIKQGAMGMGGALLGVGAIAGLVGVAVATGIGIAGVKAAGDFQQGLTILSTGAGETQRNLGMVGEGIKQISVDTATSTDQLLKGMFMVESGGYRGADALNVMRVASMGARLEGADLGAVAFSLTGLLHDYGMKSTDAAAAMNGLIKTESSGKMKMQDLTTSLGRVLPIASALGVKFPQVGGALAIMTNANMTARQAAMNLGTTLRSLAAPSGVAEKSMKTVGLSAQQVKDTLSHQGLAAALQLIEDHVGHKFPKSSVEYVKALKNILGGATGYNVALMLTGPHMKEYLANIEKITAAMNGGKKSVEGWDQTQATFNFKLDQAKQAFHVLLITIGQQLLPVLTRIAGQIAPIIGKFAEWIVKSHALENVIKAVTPFFSTMFDTVRQGMAFILPIFVFLVTQLMRLVQWVTANKTAMEAFRIIAIALGIVLLVGFTAILISIILLLAIVAIVIIVVVGVVMLLIIAAKWLAGAWNSAVGWIGGAWHTLSALAVSIFTAIKNWIVNAFNATIKWIVTAWHNAIGWIGGVWTTLKGLATSAFNAVKNAIISATMAVVNWLKNAWTNAVNWVVNAFKWLYNHNYYYQFLVDFIRVKTAAIVAWLKTAWTNAVNWVVGAWNWLKGQVSGIWNVVSSAIMSVVNAVVNWLKTAWANSVKWIGDRWNELKGLAQTAWDGVKSVFQAVWGWISGILSSLWNSISGWWTGTVQPQMQQKATSAWQKVSSVFSSAWGTYIAGPLNRLAGSIGNFFSGLAGKMVQFGKNLIQGLINGINSMLGAVGNAASNIASKITSILGFHSPTKEGPGRESDKWMPNLVKMLSSGIVAGAPQIKAATTLLLQPMAAQMHPQAVLSPRGVAPALTQAGPGAGGGPGVTVHIEHIHVNDFGPNMPRSVAERLTDEVNKRLANRYRSQYTAASSGFY